ncbi:carboxypeptidase-like regulatory domain-containing protein [Bacteroidota bacterium]
MRIPNVILGIALLNAICYKANAQELTQVIRGQVIDIESQSPLSFATITVITSDSLLGTIADDNGNFRFKKVPIGRYDIKVSYMGYETQVIPELLVSTGKETVLTIKMKEQFAKLEGVVVKAYTKKDKPLNSMATASARTFSVEEARRYAGGWDDPGRLVSSFAGITTENLRDNTIIIRGNSPKGLLWRLEGIEIPNPNHFANMATFGGGGVSALSALVVDNSDFFTGAFPAEYGNAISGVFDIKLRSGNNEKYEHAIQLGTLGIDISSEGPIGKESKASYLFNYRYSTFGLIKPILPQEIKNFVPVYQDLCFKIRMPTKKYGIFSIWGLAAQNKEDFEAEKDTALWETIDDRIYGALTQGMVGIGINHRLILPKKCLFKYLCCTNRPLHKIQWRNTWL